MALDTTERLPTQTEAIRGKLAAGKVRKAEVARSFAVVCGGPAAVDAMAGASIVSTVRSIARTGRPKGWALLGSALTVAYATLARPWMARRHQIAIEAPAQDVWPWVAQLGQDRAGFYSYQWLENLAGCRMRNADRIHPEWQHREIGETVHLGPSYGMPVTRFEPGRALALKGWGSFEVEPLDPDRCRLICRGEQTTGVARAAYVLFVELPHYVMERKMLVEIRRLAERPR
jgi:hypothetical protein